MTSRLYTTTDFKVGSWVLVYFPQDDSGKNRKLSRLWREPFQIVPKDNPDLTVSKVYFLDDGHIQIHQSHVKPCLPHFPNGYGGKRSGSDRPPKWMVEILDTHLTTPEASEQEGPEKIMSDSVQDSADHEEVTSKLLEELPGVVEEDVAETMPHVQRQEQEQLKTTPTFRYPLRSHSGRAYSRRRVV